MSITQNNIVYEDYIDIEPKQLEDPYIVKLRNDILIRENKNRFQSDITSTQENNFKNTNTTMSKKFGNNAFGNQTNHSYKGFKYKSQMQVNKINTENKAPTVVIKDFLPKVSLFLSYFNR